MRRHDPLDHGRCGIEHRQHGFDDEQLPPQHVRRKRHRDDVAVAKQRRHGDVGFGEQHVDLDHRERELGLCQQHDVRFGEQRERELGKHWERELRVFGLGVFEHEQHGLDELIC